MTTMNYENYKNKLSNKGEVIWQMKIFNEFIK